MKMAKKKNEKTDLHLVVIIYAPILASPDGVTNYPSLQSVSAKLGDTKG